MNALYLVIRRATLALQGNPRWLHFPSDEAARYSFGNERAMHAWGKSEASHAGRRMGWECRYI
jgi:hypothetical protein